MQHQAFEARFCARLQTQLQDLAAVVARVADAARQRLVHGPAGGLPPGAVQSTGDEHGPAKRHKGHAAAAVEGERLAELGCGVSALCSVHVAASPTM